MPAIVSPGAYSLERDFSLYAPQLATSVLGIVTTASRGPLNERTLITDEGTLIRTFGYPSANHPGLLAGQRYLREGNQLWVVRIGTYPTQASVTDFRNAALTVDLLEIIPTSYGTWANSISVRTSASYEDGTYRLDVLENGQVKEQFPLLRLGTAYVSDANYLPTRINGISEYISVSVLDTTQTTLEPTTSTFSGGTDGAPGDDSDIIGLGGAPPVIEPTGLQLFRDPEAIDINLLAVPGRHDRTIIAELIAICEERADCLAIITVPEGLTVQQAVQWHNGELGTPANIHPTSALNSSYAALYYPYGTVYDSYLDSQVQISLEGHVAAMMAYTDFVTDVWWAPAGFNRGLLRDVLALEHSASQGERDYMYSSGNSVNPIVNFAGQGVAIWGQRTLQRSPTALDRINVRRLLLYMRKVIATATKYLVFDPNDENTWLRFRNLIEPICRAIQGRRGITDFRVICDETTNTAERIARNEMWGKIMLQPTRAAEMVISEFVILPSGASFEEFESL